MKKLFGLIGGMLFLMTLLEVGLVGCVGYVIYKVLQHFGIL